VALYVRSLWKFQLAHDFDAADAVQVTWSVIPLEKPASQRTWSVAAATDSLQLPSISSYLASLPDVILNIIGDEPGT